MGKSRLSLSQLASQAVELEVTAPIDRQPGCRLARWWIRSPQLGWGLLKERFVPSKLLPQLVFSFRLLLTAHIFLFPFFFSCKHLFLISKTQFCSSGRLLSAYQRCVSISIMWYHVQAIERIVVSCGAPPRRVQEEFRKVGLDVDIVRLHGWVSCSMWHWAVVCYTGADLAVFISLTSNPQLNQ